MNSRTDEATETLNCSRPRRLLELEAELTQRAADLDDLEARLWREHHQRETDHWTAYRLAVAFFAVAILLVMTFTPALLKVADWAWKH